MEPISHRVQNSYKPDDINVQPTNINTTVRPNNLNTCGQPETMQMEEAIATPPVTPHPTSETGNFIAEQFAIFNRKLDKIDSLETLIKTSFTSQNKRLDDLEKQNAMLKQKSIQQDQVIDDLWIALYSKNLIFYGIMDNEEENQQDIYNIICNLIKTHSKLNIVPDIVHRTGRFSSSNRPVRVSFVKQSDRNIIFDMKDLFPSEICIKSDLPKNVRVENAILHKKKAELESMDMQCNMNFK